MSPVPAANPHRHRLTRCLLLLTALACSEGTAGETTRLPQWERSDQPALEIGVVEGAAALQFSNIAATMRLSDERIVVLDAGVPELRFFEADGAHQGSVGRRGGGPGEFRWPAYLFAMPADSIRVYDPGARRYSIFDPAGSFVRTEPGPSDTTVAFPLHLWLHDRYLISGGIGESERRPIRHALARIRTTLPDAPFHVVHVTSSGEMWIRSPRGSEWVVADRDGRALARVSAPPRFDLHEVLPEGLLGRFRDQNDVEFVHVYALRRVATRASSTRRSSGSVARETPFAERDSDEANEIRTILRSALRNTVMAQEHYWMGHRAYAAESDSLAQPLPEGVVLEILSASRNGWLALATHPRASFVCAISVGLAAGAWREGAPVCG